MVGWFEKLCELLISISLNEESDTEKLKTKSVIPDESFVQLT